jgi:hypothetical protein
MKLFTYYETLPHTEIPLSVPAALRPPAARGLFVCGLECGAREGPVPVEVGVVEGVRMTGSVGISHCDLPVDRWT